MGIVWVLCGYCMTMGTVCLCVMCGCGYYVSNVSLGVLFAYVYCVGTVVVFSPVTVVCCRLQICSNVWALMKAVPYGWKRSWPQAGSGRNRSRR